MINIRNAELADVPDILAIEQVAHLSPWTEKLIHGSFSKRSHNFVAEIDDVLVGYVFTSFVAGELTLENICVGTKQQGQGIGKLLMQHLLAMGKELLAEEIWLEVRASNLSAIKLYKGFGFVQQGIRKNYYPVADSSGKEDAILMNLCLQK